MQVDRRTFLLGGTAIAALGVAALMFRPMGSSRAAEGTFEVSLTEDEWRARLDPKVFEVLRHEATEAPGSSPLLYEHRAGIFNCAGCELPLFDSKTKYESGTGWPSFYQPLDNAVGEATDTPSWRRCWRRRRRRCWSQRLDRLQVTQARRVG